MAFLPMRLRPSPRPTVVVVLPSPAGVGVMAVTRTSLPSGRPFSESDVVEGDLGLGRAIGNERVGRYAHLGGDLGDRLHRRRACNLDVGLDGHGSRSSKSVSVCWAAPAESTRARPIVSSEPILAVRAAPAKPPLSDRCRADAMPHCTRNPSTGACPRPLDQSADGDDEQGAERSAPHGRTCAGSTPRC